MMNRRTQIILAGEAEQQAENLLRETWHPNLQGRVVLCQLRRVFRGDVLTVLDCVVLEPAQARRIRAAITAEVQPTRARPRIPHGKDFKPKTRKTP